MKLNPKGVTPEEYFSLKPGFTLYALDPDRPPSAGSVLKFIKTAICLPFFAQIPDELLSILYLSHKCRPYIQDLRPCLESLPKPSTWKLDTHPYVDKQMGFAQKAKNSANVSFSFKRRNDAIMAYTDAITALDMLRDRVATHLLPDKDCSPEKALKDAKKAQKVDTAYARSYIRQARAYELLSKPEQAQDAVILALRLSNLTTAPEDGLVEVLVQLLTEGKGFFDDQTTFKNWLLDITVTDKQSATRLEGLEGGWARRCAVRLAKWN
ncbi:hypothetical protein C8J56DRAFT_1076704 [Mycena floridula]|nr:hypothetical protein C8J56DRAFT_1076704 [Mycena floridula]